MNESEQREIMKFISVFVEDGNEINLSKILYPTTLLVSDLVFSYDIFRLAVNIIL